MFAALAAALRVWEIVPPGGRFISFGGRPPASGLILLNSSPIRLQGPGADLAWRLTHLGIQAYTHLEEDSQCLNRSNGHVSNAPPSPCPPISRNEPRSWRSIS